MHGADIDHDQDHRQELGAEQHEQAGGVEEGEDQEQHRMHGVLRGDDHEGRADADRGEQIEEQRAQHAVVLAQRRFRHGRTCPAISLGLRLGRKDVDARRKAGHDSGWLEDPPHRYGASSARFLAISRSQRSPFASSRSLS